MTTPVLAVERIFDLVAASFASAAGLVSAADLTAFHGSSATLSGAPTAAAEVAVNVVVGGTVGVAGITYRVSTDDGVTWGQTTALGTAASITVSGVVLTIAGTVLAGDTVRWVQNAPTDPDFAFGSREPAKRGSISRIVFVPGQDGRAGTLSQARFPGRNPRPLFTFDELVSVYVEGFDNDHAEDERAQWKSTRLLADAFLSALHAVAHGTWELVDAQWLVERSTRRHGYTLVLVIAVQSMVPDEPYMTAHVPRSATTTLSVPPGTVLDTEGPDVVGP